MVLTFVSASTIGTPQRNKLVQRVSHAKHDLNPSAPWPCSASSCCSSIPLGFCSVPFAVVRTRSSKFNGNKQNWHTEVLKHPQDVRHKRKYDNNANQDFSSGSIRVPLSTNHKNTWIYKGYVWFLKNLVKKCEGKKIKKKSGRKENVKKKKDLNLINYFIYFFKFISFVFLHYTKIK